MAAFHDGAKGVCVKRIGKGYSGRDSWTGSAYDWFLVGFGHAGVIAAAALPPFPCCGGELRLWGRQGGVGLEEEVFVRAGIGQGELDASHGVDDFGADLQKFQPALPR